MKAIACSLSRHPYQSFALIFAFFDSLKPLMGDPIEYLTDLLQLFLE
jgi:hypothetical protein